MITNGKIISIKRFKVDRQKVYDLSIKDNHNYFADGLLVHNCDESQDISDFALSNMLLPMIQSSKIAKVVKIGVPRSKNHFYRTAMSKEGIFLVHDWLHCPNLHNKGSQIINGVSYPVSVLERMPYPVWQRYFPNNPELWRDPPNAMSEDDFETQEEMKWMVDSDLFLSEKEQSQLLGDFSFNEPETEEYFFGLDLAGGKDIKKGKKNDSGSLSIGRERDGVKQKIAQYFFQGDAVDQMDDILAIVHPSYGKFRCKYGLGDYGYNPMMIDALGKAGVNIQSIQFGARDKNTGKNNKNAMYETAKFEIQNDRLKYPCKDYLSKHKELNQAYIQWCILEEKKGIGINSKLNAPEGFHDDAVASDALLCKALMTSPSHQVSKKKAFTFPSVLPGISTSVGIDATLNDGEGRDAYGRKDKDNPFGSGPRSL